MQICEYPALDGVVGRLAVLNGRLLARMSRMDESIFQAFRIHCGQERERAVSMMESLPKGHLFFEDAITFLLSVFMKDVAVASSHFDACEALTTGEKA